MDPLSGLTALLHLNELGFPHLVQPWVVGFQVDPVVYQRSMGGRDRTGVEPIPSPPPGCFSVELWGDVQAVRRQSPSQWELGGER